MPSTIAQLEQSLGIADILGALTKDFSAAVSTVITGVSAWFGQEFLKLTIEAINQTNAALQHFIQGIESGRSWGEAMSAMLTEVWNDVQSDLAMLATDFVEAVGRVLANIGLISGQPA